VPVRHFEVQSRECYDVRTNNDITLTFAQCLQLFCRVSYETFAKVTVNIQIFAFPTHFLLWLTISDQHYSQIVYMSGLSICPYSSLHVFECNVCEAKRDVRWNVIRPWKELA
jgi:hypothetical protein